MTVKTLLNSPFKTISVFYVNWKHFNFRIAIFKALNILTWHFTDSKLCIWVYTQMNLSIKKYLENDLKIVIDKFLEDYNPNNSGKTIPAIIWQSWWQGRTGLEGITKIGTESVKENAKGFKINFVCEDNYKSYVSIPDVILKWVAEGRISRTHFADYLRMALLSQNGGIWFDCAIFLSKPIGLSVLDNTFYSTKGNFYTYRYISQDFWSTGCMGCAKHFPMMDLYLKLFESYFAKHKVIIDYYLTDYLMRIAYEKIPEVKRAVDNVPFNNPRKQDLTYKLNDCYDEKIFEELCKDTTVFKCSRKIKLKDRTPNGRVTIFGHLKNKYKIK